jgi:hypothetical protein
MARDGHSGYRKSQGWDAYWDRIEKEKLERGCKKLLAAMDTPEGKETLTRAAVAFFAGKLPGRTEPPKAKNWRPRLRSRP